MKIFSLVSFVFFALILCAAQGIAATTPPKGAVLTRSNDNFRTGWQQQETILTPSTISSLRLSHGCCLQIRSTPSRSSYQASSMATTLFLSPTNRIGSTRSTQSLAPFLERSILGVRSRSRRVAGVERMWELVRLR